MDSVVVYYEIDPRQTPWPPNPPIENSYLEVGVSLLEDRKVYVDEKDAREQFDGTYWRKLINLGPPVMSGMVTISFEKIKEPEPPKPPELYPPIVETSGVLNVGHRTATPEGMVLDTGNDPCQIRFLYWPKGQDKKCDCNSLGTFRGLCTIL